MPNVHPIHSILFENKKEKTHTYQQYFGVFSAKHIDYATQFLLEHLKVLPDEHSILDLASGNGVISTEIRKDFKFFCFK